MHVELAVVADCDLMHVDQTEEAAFADVFVGDELDNPGSFGSFTQKWLEF